MRFGVIVKIYCQIWVLLKNSLIKIQIVRNISSILKYNFLHFTSKISLLKHFSSFFWSFLFGCFLPITAHFYWVILCCAQIVSSQQIVPFRVRVQFFVENLLLWSTISLSQSSFVIMLCTIFCYYWQLVVFHDALCRNYDLIFSLLINQLVLF